MATNGGLLRAPRRNSHSQGAANIPINQQPHDVAVINTLDYKKMLMLERNKIIELSNELKNQEQKDVELIKRINKLNLHFHAKIETLAHTLKPKEAQEIQMFVEDTNKAVVAAAEELGLPVSYVDIRQINVTYNGIKRPLHEHLNEQFLRSDDESHFVAILDPLHDPANGWDINVDENFLVASDPANYIYGLMDLRRGAYIPHVKSLEHLRAMSVDIRSAYFKDKRYHRHMNGDGFVSDEAKVDPFSVVEKSALVVGTSVVINSDVKGNATVEDSRVTDSIISEDATVKNADIKGSNITGNAQVEGQGGAINIENSSVEGSPEVSGNDIKISDSSVSGNAVINGNDIEIAENSRVYENARVEGEHVQIYGGSTIHGTHTINNQTGNPLIYPTGDYTS